MPTNGQTVKIAHYTRSKFNSLTNKDNATIYYVEETDGKIKQYIGNTHVVSDIPSWIGSSKPSYTASEVGARPDNWAPTWSQVTDKPTWIGSSKPTYTASEVGAAATSHSHNIATTSANGFMSSDDKTKLEGIATGAQVNRAIATTAQAQAGTNNSNVMTPLRVKEAIAANAGTVTSVLSGTQINGMAMTVANGTTTPTIGTSITNAASFRSAIGAGTSSFSGSYNDLSNKPTIPSIPSVMTTTEGNTGTATTQRTINAANLKSIILNHSPAGSRPASDVSAWAKKSSLAIGDIPTGTTGSTVALGNHTHSVASTSVAGFMSTSDKTKLNGIATNATANAGTVTSVLSGTQINGMAMTVANGTTTPTIGTSITNAASFRSAIGLGNVDNKSSATIRSEITASNIMTALANLPNI